MSTRSLALRLAALAVCLAAGPASAQPVLQSFQNYVGGLSGPIGVMNAGHIEQWDAPYRLYHQPATRLVADFVGLGSFLPGRLEHRDGNSLVHLELGTLPIHARTDQAIAGATNLLTAAPELPAP